MSGPTPSPFSAADPTLGYLYQVRLALLWSLRRLKVSVDFDISVETLDDVTFEPQGLPPELLQTKHHRSGTPNLTDASPDLWKSLRVWFDGHAAGAIPDGAMHFLVTTSTASPRSIAARLRAGSSRDVGAALAALEAVAQTSSSQENSAAYKSFLSASPSKRQAIVGSITVIDASPTILDLDQELLSELIHAAKRELLPVFLQRLEGWWLQRTIQQLSSGTACQPAGRILAVEVDAQIADLREQFKAEALPIDDDLLALALDDGALSKHSQSTFVRQLELANLGNRRIAFAVRDYYRALTQRSRWLRDDLLMVGEIGKYERRLVEEWERAFETMKDELGATAADDVKIAAAKKLIAWADGATFPLRPAVTEPFVTRGSFHMLADEPSHAPRIGWHPDFRDRLAALLRLDPGIAQ